MADHTMTDPTAVSVPLTYTHQQTPVRLLELPPALLALISSPNPPTLYLKSRPCPPSAPASSSLYNAVLCTPTQTHTLRQVHSSNTVFLCSPTPNSLTILSTASSFLELLAAPSGPQLLLPHLKPYHLSPSSTSDDDEDEFAARTEETAISKAQLCADTPVSPAEFEDAWAEALAFEHAGSCYVPTASAVCRVLEAVKIGCQAGGLRVPGAAVAEIVEAVEDEGFPVGLVEAVLGDGDGGRWCRVAGRAVLESWYDERKGRRDGTGAGSDMLTVGFLGRWRKIVPDDLAGGCRLEVIKEWHTLPSQNTVRFVPGGVGGGSKAVEEETKSSVEGGTKNKWHEKFRKGKTN